MTCAETRPETHEQLRGSPTSRFALVPAPAWAPAWAPALALGWESEDAWVVPLPVVGTFHPVAPLEGTWHGHLAASQDVAAPVARAAQAWSNEWVSHDRAEGTCHQVVLAGGTSLPGLAPILVLADQVARAAQAS